MKIDINNLIVVNGTQENLELALKENEQFKNAVLDFLEGQKNGENYGVAFYACGYNGQGQQDFIKHMKEQYNLIVF